LCVYVCPRQALVEERDSLRTLLVGLQARVAESTSAARERNSVLRRAAILLDNLQAWVGIQIQKAQPDSGVPRGVVIASVKDGPAQEAGLCQGRGCLVTECAALYFIMSVVHCVRTRRRLSACSCPRLCRALQAMWWSA
jgi:hypothetical protein